MQTIKIFIASSEELHLERLEFTDMIQQLNRAFRPRGIELEPVKWEYLDASMGAERKQTEYNNALRECEVCLVMYWNRFGEYTEEELVTAYEGLKAGQNPRKLYVYFKEPVTELSDELKDFKASFATQYGHFYCKFENVDTLRLNFILQFEQYQSDVLGQEPIVKISDSKVEVGGQKMVDLVKVPFAGKNPTFQSLRDRGEKLEQEIKSLEGVLAMMPNDAIVGMLRQKRIDRANLNKELEELENSLLDTAKQIVKLTGKSSSVRLRKAIELFEQGDNKGANAVLDFGEIKADMEQNARRIGQARELEESALKALKSNINECELKVRTLQAEKIIGWKDEIIQIYLKCFQYAKIAFQGKGEWTYLVWNTLRVIESMADSLDWKDNVLGAENLCRQCIQLLGNGLASPYPGSSSVDDQMDAWHIIQHLNEQKQKSIDADIANYSVSDWDCTD